MERIRAHVIAVVWLAALGCGGGDRDRDPPVPDPEVVPDTAEATEPVSDWGFANDAATVPLCQIQVDAGLLPHSINLNCMSDGGELFLSCSNCDGKRWSTAVLNNPQARLRAAGVIYPVNVTRVTDPLVLDRAWIARAAKTGRPTDTPRQEGWWSFQVTSR